MLGLDPVGLTVNVSFEQTHSLGDQIGLVGDHSETAAMVDVQKCEVESQQVEHPPVNDHHFAVISNQVFGRARDVHAALHQAFFHLPDLFEVFSIGVGDQRMDIDAACGGGDQLLFDLQPIQAVENDLDPLSRASDSFEKRLNAVAWLNDNLHFPLRSDSLDQFTHYEAPLRGELRRRLLISCPVPVFKKRFGRLPDGGLEFAYAFPNLRREAFG